MANEKYIESVKKIYEIILPIGKPRDRRDKKKFYNHIQKWHHKEFEDFYISVCHDSKFLSSRFKDKIYLDFEGKHSVSFGSVIQVAKHHLSRGTLGPVLYSFDVLGLIPEKTKVMSSLVMAEAIIAIKQLLAYAFMSKLVKDGIEEFKPSEHGQMLCEFLDKLAIIE